MIDDKPPIRVDIWHNIVWSKYKGEVFSSLHRLNDTGELDIRFYQIAETQGDRTSLSGLDLSHHRYPFELLFKGSYDKIGFFNRVLKILHYTIKSDGQLILLTGYNRIEYWAQLIALKLKRKKIAVFCDSTIYDQPQTFFKGLLKRIYFTSVDGVFGYGQRSRDYVLHYGADSRHVFYRCQAAALPHDYVQEKAMADRLDMAPSPNAPRYLFVGLLSKGKNIGTLINAFALVIKKLPEAKLIIVGDGPERESLLALVHNLQFEDAVVFAGRKSGADLFDEYKKATCLILPSLSEAWGLVVNEALSYGCPAIVSERCGCVPELIIEGKTGFVHKVTDRDDLAAKMLQAPIQFFDIQQTTQTCIDHINEYTPDKAARQILNGIRVILKISDQSQ